MFFINMQPFFNHPVFQAFEETHFLISILSKERMRVPPFSPVLIAWPSHYDRH